MIKNIFKEMTFKGIVNLLVSIFFFVLYALSATGIVLVTLYLLNRIIIQDKNINFTAYWWTLGGLLVAKTIFNSIADIAKHFAGFDLIEQLRKKIIFKLKKFSLGFYTNERLGEMSTIIHKDVDNMEMVVAHLWSRMSADFLTAFILAGGLFWLHYQMGIAMVILLPIALWVLYRDIDKNLVAEKKSQNALANMVSLFVEYVKGIPTLKIFGTKGLFKNRLENSIHEFGDNSKEVSFLTAKHTGKYIFFMEASFALMATFGAYLVYKESLSLFHYLIFIVASKEFYKPFINIETHFLDYVKVKDSYNRISKLLNEEIIENPRHPQTTEKFDIDFNGVSFAYEKESFEMKNISFTVPQNTVTALVGSSGSGKTTITNLLLRFWQPQSGTIRIGGVEIQNMDYDYLLGKISIVMQNVVLFADSIYNNIKVGNKNATQEQIEEAAKHAMIHDFIEQLPQGYQTMIGENGVGLSGGQKQRLSIARAFLKDAPILLLDEITSNVDPINEYKIQTAMSNLIKNRTVLVIAHHLNTVQNVDQIVVMDKGTLKEKGKHAKLITEGGIYAQLSTNS